jgi:hypothetical protein
MELSDVIAFMRQEAKRLEYKANTITSLKHSITPIILGTSELSYERVFGWLERNKPTMLVPSKKQYEEFVSCAEEVDGLVADGSRTALEAANAQLKKVKYFANRLANTLRDTADDLMSDEQIINLISNIRIEDVDNLSGLFRKLQNLPKSRPMPENEELWSQADENVRKKIDEAGTKTDLNDKEEEDWWEREDSRELYRLITQEYSDIRVQIEGKSLEEMAEMVVKEGKAKSPLEAMAQLASKAEMDAIIESRLWRKIEREYRKIDPDYDQTLSKGEKEADDVIEQIKKSFFSNELLVKLDGMLDEKLSNNLQQIQGYMIFDFLHQSDTIDIIKNSLVALQEIKSEVERQPKEEQATKRETRKAKKTEKKYQPWKNPGDACFIIEDNRVKFHYNGEIKDLRLKNASRTHKLFGWLVDGPVRSVQIERDICKEGTRPTDVVKFANRLLNEKIALLGFVGVPQNVRFIKHGDFTSDYQCTLPKYRSVEDMECAYLQEPLVDDRKLKALDEAEESFD